MAVDDGSLVGYWRSSIWCAMEAVSGKAEDEATEADELVTCEDGGGLSAINTAFPFGFCFSRLDDVKRVTLAA